MFKKKKTDPDKSAGISSKGLNKRWICNKTNDTEKKKKKADADKDIRFSSKRVK